MLGDETPGPGLYGEEETTDGDLSDVTAAVVGGDGREVEYVRGLVEAGADVRAIGCMPEAAEIMGHPQAESAEEALSGADAVLTTVVYITEEGMVYTPGWDGEFHQSEFRHMDPGSLLVIGTSTDEIDDIADEVGFRVHEYGDDDELMLLRAPTIAEGALKIAIDNSVVTLHDNECVVLGFGRMGFTMTRSLVPLGADVTVVARDRSQLARAREMGATPVHLDRLAETVADAAFVFNTVPVELLSRDVLEGMDEGSVVVDLASVPGGTDFEAAEELGVDATLARGLGGRAPKTAGELQWHGIRRMLLEQLDLAE
jgi:dipicolinate synthase subunit A